MDSLDDKTGNPLENLFGGNKSNQIDALLELITTNNIEIKTDLNITQIRILTQVKYYKLLEEYPEKSSMEILSEVVEYYLTLMCSLKRKSRQEVIDGLKQMLPENEMGNAIGQLIPGK